MLHNSRLARTLLIGLILSVIASTWLLTSHPVRRRQLISQLNGIIPTVVEQAAEDIEFAKLPKETVPAASNQTLATLPSSRIDLFNGPLRKNPLNPRYFTDDSGKAIFLTGSHTWSSLQDNGGSDPPPIFDYERYLDFLVQNNHNFFRLWVWEQTRWTVETTDDEYWFSPFPYQRTGPGTALDGKPKFDLTKFDQAYFDRLRERVVAAGRRGIYVSVMLFDGWSIESSKGQYGLNNPWHGHPFNIGNNINGIDGDANKNDSGEEVHQGSNEAVTALQKSYVRKVIDTLNDLDNVLYEIANESNNNSEPWQYQLIDEIHSYEAGLPKQHPVGMTAVWPGGYNPALLAGPADWVSLNNDDGTYLTDPPAADGTKVSILDTDHLCGICGDRYWVWKSFTRGHNPIFMDGYDGAGYGVGGEGFNFHDPVWVSLRKNLGYVLSYANRMDLNAMEPRADLASSHYCLAKPTMSDAEYLIYVPDAERITVNLTNTQGRLAIEWLNPETGEKYTGSFTTGAGGREFQVPFAGDAVLYLYSTQSMSPTLGP
jgi:hypothetical protein